MKIFSAEQIKRADLFTMEEDPISSLDLMERAGHVLTDRIHEIFPTTPTYVIFVGPGNNGGDGLVIARLLQQNSRSVKVYVLEAEKYSKEFQANLKRLDQTIELIYIRNKQDVSFDKIDPNAIIIDALFGNGLNRPLDDLAAELVSRINILPHFKLAIDVPSGLSADGGHISTAKNTIMANLTLTIQFPKLSFFFAENFQFTGKWESLNISLSKKFIEKEATQHYYLDDEMIFDLISVRPAVGHKGTFGHALIVAGSIGKIGASILSSRAALRTGCGLLSLQVPSSGVSSVHANLPEAMLIADENPNFISTNVKDISQYNAVGFGPGVGKNKETANVLKSLIQNVAQPLVIDADGVNILSENLTWTSFLNGHTILTPHPGEFDRLTKKHASGEERFRTQLEFSKKTGAYVVLKGRNTCVTTPGGLAFLNSTGNNGMATAGSGDVLTGIITSLCAQGYSALHASILGVYLHGYAGDKASQSMSKSALIASDIIEHIRDFFLVFEK